MIFDNIFRIIKGKKIVILGQNEAGKTTLNTFLREMKLVKHYEITSDLKKINPATYRKDNIKLIRAAALLTMIGIIVNRLNLTVIGFRWEDAVRYVPSWKEIMITATVILTEIWVFRWIVRRLPVLRESPDWAKHK